MKKIFLSIVSIFFLSTSLSEACDCTNDAPFFNVIANTKLIALVKVKKHKNFVDMYRTKTPLSMEVEVIEVLRGKETRKTIEIFGNNGMLCRPFVLQFKEGSTWVLGIDQGYEQGLQEKTDYYISNCGTYWISAENASLSGIISEGNTLDKPGVMNLAQFRQRLKKKN